MKRLLRPKAHIEKKPVGRPRKHPKTVDASTTVDSDSKDSDSKEETCDDTCETCGTCVESDREYIGLTKPLNDKQYEFFVDFTHHIQNKNYGIYLLGAPAGTGKTFTIKILYEWCRQYASCPVVLAPTHKACSLFTSPIIAQTVHRYLNCQGDYDDDGSISFFGNWVCSLCGQEYVKPPFPTGEVTKAMKDRYDIETKQVYAQFQSHVLECTNVNNSFKHTNSKKELPHRIIVVDECSMLPAEALNLFKLHAKSALILFTGDVNQIPPVHYDYSPLFEYKHHVRRYEFTEIMRTKDDVIRTFSDAFKDAIYTKRHVPTTSQQITLQNVLDKFKQGQDIVLLNWRNTEKERYNMLIRRALYVHSETEVLHPYYPNEKLLFSGFRDTRKEPYYLTVDTYIEYIKPILKDIVNVEDEIALKFYSNDIVTIKTVSDIVKVIPYYNISDKKRIKEEVIEFWRLVDTHGVCWYKVKEAHLGKWIKIMTHFRKEIIKSKQPKKYWPSYYAMRNLLNAELDYTYSITTHKSQGSQWKNVVVNIKDIRSDTKVLNYKLAYTAVTRAMNELYFI